VRASRLLSLLLLLQTRGRMTARDLADELEVSIRTVYRDVESLSAAGVPVYADRGPDGGYRLLEGYRTRLTGLTTGEAESLFLSGMPGPASQLGLGDVVAAAELKLMAALPPDLRSRAARIRERFHLDAPGWFRAPDDVPHLQAVADAVWNQQRIRVLYRRWARPQQVERVLEPIGVVLKAGTWYLIARSHHPETEPHSDPSATKTPPHETPPHETPHDDEAPQTKAPRTYRVSRILTLKPLPQRFERPPGFDLAAYWDAYATRFEADSYRDHATVRLSPAGLERAPILLPPVMARAVHDNAGPPDPTGWTPVTLPVESLRHAHVEFLKLGADVEVLAPPRLRAMMADTARALADRYLH
jgi:predicted DNA-binding transcriptional regulator YafY